MAEIRTSISSRSRRRSSASRTPKCRHILDLSDIEKLVFIKSFDFVIMEILGVVWWLDEEIPNAGNAVMRLKDFGKEVRFMSNYGGYTDAQFLRRMATIGITDVKKSDVSCTCKTLTQYLKRFMGGQTVFSLCNEEMNKEFYKRGIDVVCLEPSTTVTLDDIVRNLCENEPVGAVVLDWNMNLTYADLAMAHHFLQRDGCAFIVGSTDSFGPVSRKLRTLGPGHFMNMLRESTGREPIIWGRPARCLCEELRTYFKITDPKRVLFIGSDIKTDIEFAISCGYQACFVNTGTSKLREVMSVSENYQPDYVAGSIGEFVAVLNTVTKLVELAAQRASSERSSGETEEKTPGESEDRTPRESEDKTTRRSTLKAALNSDDKSPHEYDESSQRVSAYKSPSVFEDRTPRESEDKTTRRSTLKASLNSDDKSPHEYDESSQRVSAYKSPSVFEDRTPRESEDKTTRRSTLKAALNSDDISPHEYDESSQRVSYDKSPSVSDVKATNLPDTTIPALMNERSSRVSDQKSPRASRRRSRMSKKNAS